MSVPKWVSVWLKGVGIAVDDFVAVFEAAAAKIDAPTELTDAVALWIQEHIKAQLSPSVVLGFAALVVAELKSGAPGYDKDAAGLL